MIDVEIRMTEPITVAYLPMKGAYNQVPEAMGTLYGWTAQHGFTPVGMPTTVYYSTPGSGPESEALWELQAPLAGDPAEQPSDDDGCGIKRIESHQIASTMYKGPYELISPTYDELGRWVGTNGFVMAGPPSEVYYSDPADTRPEDYLTEIRFPVIKA